LIEFEVMFDAQWEEKEKREMIGQSKETVVSKEVEKERETWNVETTGHNGFYP